MLFTVFGVLALLTSMVLLYAVSRIQKTTLALFEKVQAENDALKTNQEVAARAKEDEERLILLPNGMTGRAGDYETRDDGVLVRRDRWKVGFGNIVTVLMGSRTSFEIDEVVEKVRALAVAARADYESGGNGTFGSAPLWGPCPNSACREGQVREKGEWVDCPVCEGRAKVVLEEPTARPEPEVAP